MCGFGVNAGQNRNRTRRRPPDFAPSSETPGGYVGQAVLEKACSPRGVLSLQRDPQRPLTW
jgi:hypothetical protein